MKFLAGTFILWILLRREFGTYAAFATKPNPNGGIFGKPQVASNAPGVTFSFSNLMQRLNDTTKNLSTFGGLFGG